MAEVICPKQKRDDPAYYDYKDNLCDSLAERELRFWLPAKSILAESRYSSFKEAE